MWYLDPTEPRFLQGHKAQSEVPWDAGFALTLEEWTCAYIIEEIGYFFWASSLVPFGP